MSNEPGDPLERLRALVVRLRGPDGCPWDRQQTLADLRAYLLEEAHEAAAAIDAGDPTELAGELGDLLFLLVFAAELGREAGGPDLTRVAASAEAKMIARHPHVFGDERAADAEAVRKVWGRRKDAERGAGASLLDGVPPTLPPLVAAYRMTQKAADVGFDWPRLEGVLAKLDEEIAELRGALAETDGGERERLRHEIGDLLFTVANLARWLEIDPDAALAGANVRFRRRFGHVERGLEARGRPLPEASLDEMEALWRLAKEGD